jgi:CheY-like chemotaxis protein
MLDRRIAAVTGHAHMTGVSPRSALPLAGRHILVVEDEMIIALDLSDAINEMGGTTTMVAHLAKAATLAATQTFDAAILDLNLAGEAVYPVADHLIRRGIPFVIASGYDADGIAAAYRDRPLLAKPYARQDIEAMLLMALSSGGGQAVSA